MKDYLEALNQLGFSIREFGENTFLVDAFPDGIKREELETVLITIVQELGEQQESRQLQIKKEERLALAACKASSLKTKRLSLDEAQSIVNQLFTCKIPFQCPLGRATLLYICPEELANYFN